MFYNYQKYHQQTSAIHRHCYINSFLFVSLQEVREKYAPSK